MADFLEERLPIDVRLGASYADEYAVEITTTRGGSEHRRLVHPYPVRNFSVNYTLGHSDLWARVVNLYHRAYGMYAGFRVRCLDDFSTNGNTGAPTATDQPMALVYTGVYQLQTRYGLGGTPLAVGYPLRTIFKPVSGTVKVGVSIANFDDTFLTYMMDGMKAWGKAHPGEVELTFTDAKEDMAKEQLQW